MNFAAVIPGLGSQEKGMCLDLARSYKSVARLIDNVDNAFGLTPSGKLLSQIMFEGNPFEQMIPENGLPMLVVNTMATITALEEESGRKLNEIVSCISGHSFGEYAALHAVGSMDVKDTIPHLRECGRRMLEVLPMGVSAMAAIGKKIKKTDDNAGGNADAGPEVTPGLIEEIIDRASRPGGNDANREICVIANHNTPHQYIISGHAPAINRAVAYAKEKGLAATLLNGLPWAAHSPFMENRPRMSFGKP